MNTVFADTSFFLALLRADDPAHNRAKSELAKNREIITSEFVFLELGNACSRAADHEDFIQLVTAARASARMKVVALDSRLLDRGIELMSKRSDKDWSLTDCISFVIMDEYGVREALTADKDFEQGGYIALLR